VSPSMLRCKACLANCIIETDHCGTDYPNPRRSWMSTEPTTVSDERPSNARMRSRTPVVRYVRMILPTRANKKSARIVFLLVASGPILDLCALTAKLGVKGEPFRRRDAIRIIVTGVIERSTCRNTGAIDARTFGLKT
jgi:hypothetical protein